MSKYLVVGAGSIGGAVATRLASEGHAVTVASRSGTGPEHELVTRVSADASDPRRLGELGAGCDAIFNCVNPQYHRWPTDWPPIANALLASAEESQAVLVTLSNLYPYGAPAGPMTPESPMLATYEKALVRATMWQDALDAHREGRIRACEVRASDFLGAGSQSMLGDRVIPRVLRGKTCRVIGNPDMLHSWTFTNDVARTLVACARTPSAWGRAWHAPTNPPRTQREAINDVADVAGCQHVKVTSIPTPAIRLMGIFDPMIRELPKTMYQFSKPFVIDDQSTRDEFALEPTPWRDVLEATIQRYR
jgi:nucleoside-diphosphate-sugar epimerase